MVLEGIIHLFILSLMHLFIYYLWISYPKPTLFQIYQKTRMLYSGFPLASYGCRMQDFLGFISKHTQYNFKLRAGFPDAPLSAPAGHTDLSAAAS